MTSASAGTAAVHHELSVRLVPGESRLMGSDTITLSENSQWPPELFLNPRAAVSDVRVNGSSVGHAFSEGRLQLLGDGTKRPADGRIAVRYEAVFDDPVPAMPVNTDNPGYGVTGTINDQGTFLLAGAGWYPVIPDSQATFELTVTAPEGVVAVTAGSLVKRVSSSQSTVCTWSVERPVDGLSLSAARYVVREKTAGHLKAMTFMLEETDALSGDYLDAVLGYLSDYEALFGPYPFEKFAVVENFFPTGYGFPSYTLLGSRVIRLPFIIQTSLGHEIAHCWWGNGVRVDYRQGNWCEGLTTYVADYRASARASPAAAREYRAQLLRNYAALVSPADDFPLARFASRTDPVTKAVGYDKGAMVFHMLRTRVGDDAFWQTLRDLVRQRLFQEVAWDDLRQAFEARSHLDLEAFFDQWVKRSGAPRLALEGVTVGRRGDGWRVAGSVVQAAPAYDLELTLRIDGRAGPADMRLAVSGVAADFEIFSTGEPRQLSLDPDFDVFRALYPEEIPPSVNSLKGAGAVRVVVADNLSSGLQPSVEVLVRSLGLTRYEVLTEGQDAESAQKDSDLLYIGRPPAILAGEDLPGPLRLQRDAFELNGRRYDQPGDAFFGVFHNPNAPGRVLAVFLPLSASAAAAAAHKITHYGKYSYLAFRRGENQDKGTWPTVTSPLTRTLTAAGPSGRERQR